MRRIYFHSTNLSRKHMTVTCAVICVWFKLELLRRFIPLFIPKYIWLIVICIQMSLNDDVLSPTPAGNNSHFTKVHRQMFTNLAFSWKKGATIRSNLCRSQVHRNFLGLRPQIPHDPLLLPSEHASTKPGTTPRRSISVVAWMAADKSNLNGG